MPREGVGEMEESSSSEEAWNKWREQQRGMFERFAFPNRIGAAALAAVQAISRIKDLDLIRKRTRWGGSRPGKRSNVDRGVRFGAERIYRDYFSAVPTYGELHFQRRYRMPRSLFLRIHDSILEKDPYFCERQDATKKLGASSYQKMTAAIRMLAYGASSDSLDEYCRISETTAKICMKKFCDDVYEIFGREYLRMPTAQDLIRIQEASARQGFPGCIGSLDCMHWIWKNCPTAHQGQYQGKEKAPTIVLEAVADHGLWIWHAFFGMPGACNDINVVDNSLLFDEIMAGRFPPPLEYVVNGVTRRRGYYLADGIYNRWSVLVQGYRQPKSEQERLFTRLQEAKRKDVERAFGVLQGKWQILAHPCRLWYERQMGSIVRCCIVLHNMIIECNRKGDPVDPLDAEGGSKRRGGEAEVDQVGQTGERVEGAFENACTRIVEMGQTPGTVANLLLSIKEVTSEAGYHALRQDLVDHIWSVFGNKEKDLNIA